MGSNQITPTKTIESTSVVIKANNTLKSKLLWQLHLFDVGQGLSVLITQKNQALLYDTGASYPSGFNMVDSVILPYLQYAGIKELDKVFLSHSDNDHAGGLSQLMSGIKVKQLISNDSQLIAPYQNTQSCYQGMNFNWKGLSVSALWPIAAKIKGDFTTFKSDVDKVSLDTLSQEEKKIINKSFQKIPNSTTKQGNDDSCVLLISDGKHNILLTGDITEKIEHKLLSQYPKLKVDVLVVPHHGSKTSSSAAFIKQLDPQVALVSAGFLNRWHMPVKQVTTRYAQQSVPLINTSKKGQIVLTFTDDFIVENYHDDLRPFWFYH